MITDDEFRDLADISKLSFSSDEKVGIMDWLDDMIKLFVPMQEIDVTGIEELINPLAVSNVFREDINIQVDHKVDTVNNEMTREDGYFYVPKVMDE